MAPLGGVRLDMLHSHNGHSFVPSRTISDQVPARHGRGPIADGPLTRERALSDPTHTTRMLRHKREDPLRRVTGARLFAEM
ncbi:hypothetical protein Psi01_21910 [Planobispora siamensis]|uniref:Uncharacterized protein n=1 Tax=Planobispora siamensis TaxID=936338 RepID=A0A8J3WL77_9ACTN|nr:hypothetical protein Psi01_21910 [Planobispora siamensis]